MRDACVRAAVRSMLEARHASEPDVVIADELPTDRASARIDVAVLNGHLHGFELKSDRDTLDRLPRQAVAFSAAMQAMTLVAATRHVARSVAMVPDWWSVLEARPTPAGGVRLVRLRRGRRNPRPDPGAMVRLLERVELLAVLHRHGIGRGVRTASYAAIAEKVCSLPAATVADEVRAELKFRARWEAAHEATAFGRSVLDINPPTTAIIVAPATSCAGWP